MRLSTRLTHSVRSSPCLSTTGGVPVWQTIQNPGLFTSLPMPSFPVISKRGFAIRRTGGPSRNCRVHALNAPSREGSVNRHEPTAGPIAHYGNAQHSTVVFPRAQLISSHVQLELQWGHDQWYHQSSSHPKTASIQLTSVLVCRYPCPPSGFSNLKRALPAAAPPRQKRVKQRFKRHSYLTSSRRPPHSGAGSAIIHH